MSTVKARTNKGIETLPKIQCIEISNNRWVEKSYHKTHYINCDDCGISDQITGDPINRQLYSIITSCKVNFYLIHDTKKSLCSDCYNKIYIKCCGCGSFYLKTDTVINNKGKNICLKCFQPVERWDYKPNSNFIGHDVDNIFLGVELEVDTENKQQEIASYIHEIIRGRGYIKRDGSINNIPGGQRERIHGETGFEVVTQPMSLPEQLSFWYEFIEDFSKDLKIIPSCGLHIHVSRNPISIVHTLKLCKFIHSNVNRKFVHFIAGRKGNEYCSYHGKRNWDETLKQREYTRKEAINLTSEETFEFRIFSATLDYPVLAARFEFARAIMDYVRYSKRSDNPTAKGFRDWLSTDVNMSYDYVNLKTYIHDNWSK